MANKKNKIDTRPFIVTPLTKGYQVDTLVNKKPYNSGHSSRRSAINDILRQIPVNHQIIIADMGEVNYAKD